VRFSELGGKEIINLADGERLGRLGECDLELDETTGAIVNLVTPARSGLRRGRSPVAIPWWSVRRIGPDVLIVELDPDANRPRQP
jgi:YlmC/YmxH family sporulation protein